MKEIKLSVCFVVKNEEKYLEKALKSVKNVASEIIVVDTGSTDQSVHIANKFTSKVYSIKWHDDFSKARNYALSKAKGEWILFLDGDECLDPQTAQNLLERIKEPDIEGYLIKVLNYYHAGKQIELAPDVIFRLFRNQKAYRFTGAIHEQICDNIIAAKPDAKIVIAEDICVIHYGYLPEEISAKNKAERNTSLLIKAVKKNPHNLLDRFHLGVEYFRVGDLENALQSFLMVLDKVDLRAVYVPKLMRYITKCHYLLGDFNAALQFINTVWIKYFSDNGDLYYLKGLICRELGRQNEAYTAFKTCLTVPPQPNYYANLYCQYKDKIYHQLGEVAEYFMDKETALEYYIKALKENSNSVLSLSRIISILKPRENPEYTIQALNSVFDLSDTGIQLDLGYYFFQERAYGLAVHYISLAGGKTLLKPEMHLMRGICYLRQGHFAPALEDLNSVKPSEGPYLGAQGNLFLFYWMHHLLQKSDECLNKIKEAGSNPVLVEILRLLQENQPGYLDDIPWDQQLIIGEVIEILKQLVELPDIEGFEMAWRSFESFFDVRPYKILGDMFYNCGRYDRAAEEYQQLHLQGNAADEIVYRLGKCLWYQKDLRQAETCYNQAIANGYTSPQVNWEIARLHQEIALQKLEEGLNKYPGNKEIASMIAKIKETLVEV